MSVAATNPYSTGTGNGSATAFPFTFACRNTAEIAVYVNGTQQIAGFSVSLNSDFNGGTVTFTSAPANAAVVIIASQPSLTQPIAFENSGPYSPSTVDDAVDAAAIRSIYLKGLLDRAPKVPLGETIGAIPAKSARAGLSFGFDANGDPAAVNPGGADSALRTDLANDGGDALIRVKRSETGAVGRTLQVWARQFVFAADFGAAGDGVTDDTAALQKALNTGKLVIVSHLATYLISSGLDHVTGSGLVCFDGIATIKAKTGAGGFNVKDVTGTNRMNLDRNMFRCNQTDNVALHNIHFTTDGLNDVVIHGVRLYGGMATKGYSLRVSFSGFAVSSMVVLSSTGDGERKIIHVVSARDCGTAIGGSSGTYWTYTTSPVAVYPQTTVVEIDNDTISGAASVAGYIRIDSISNVLFTGAALTNFGQQTDGITFVTHGPGSTSGWDVDVGVINGVGEPIDVQTNSHTIRIDTIKNAYNFAVKLIHGAQYNDIEVGTIEASGEAAVAIFGSSDAVLDTLGNSIRVGTVKNPGSYGIGPAATDASVVLFGNTTTAMKPIRNTVQIDNVIGDGVNLDCVVTDGGSDQNNDNLVIIGKASGYAKSVSAPATNVRVRYLGRCFTELTMGSTQTLTSAATTQLNFDTAGTDLEAIAVTASKKVTVKWPGLYRVQAQALMSNWQVGSTDQWALSIRKNTTVVGNAKGRIQFAAKDEIGVVSKTIYVTESEIGTAAADLSVWMLQDTGANKTVGNTAGMTFLTVERVG